MKESERKINKYSRLLEAVNKIQLNFYQQDDFRKLLNKLFEEILILINSRFGFVAEVLRDEQGIPYLNSNELVEFYLMEIPDTTIREKGLQRVLPISSQVNRLSGVISDFKLFEKNAGRKIKVVPKELELVGFIEDLARGFSNKYLLGRLVKLLLPSSKKKVKTDHRLLYHIVSNLVDNACKYSSQFERFPEIKLSYMEDTYCFCVKDYGIGIPKEDQKFVFDSFFRAKNVSTIQGTGLVLFWFSIIAR